MQTNALHKGLNNGLTRNFISTAIHMVKTQGFFSLWRGAIFYLCTYTPLNIILNILKPKILEATIPKDFHLRNDFYRFVILIGGGFISDLFGLALMAPASYILTQISLDGLKLGAQFDFLASASTAFSSLGSLLVNNPMQLYTGLGIILLGKTVETVISFFLSNILQRRAHKTAPKFLFLSNIGMKWVLQFVVYPFDTMWRRSMLSSGNYNGALSAMTNSAFSQGGLYDGYAVHILRHNFNDFYQIPFVLTYKE